MSETIRRSFVSYGTLLTAVVTAAGAGILVQDAVAAMVQAPEANRSEFAAEFTRLEEEMEQAYESYVENVRKQAEADEVPRTKPTAAEPTDPRLAVLAKMDALAERATGSADAGDIAVKTFIWSAAFRLDPEKLLERFDRAARHPSHRDIGEAVGLVVDVHSRDGTPQEWVDRLAAIAKKAGRSEVGVTAVFATGQIHLAAAQAARGPGDRATPDSSEQLKKAKEAFAEVSALDPESQYVETAKGYIYEIENLQPGMPAPAFTGTTLAGEKISLSDFRGKVVLLDIWATWCPPCMAEAAALREAAERFAGKPFVIVGISLDDFREMLESTVQQKHLPGMHIWDESGRENPIAEKYNAETLPTWYLIDQKGILRARDPFGEKLIPAIETLLSEAP